MDNRILESFFFNHYEKFEINSLQGMVLPCWELVGDEHCNETDQQYSLTH